jgi:PAS domain S-box-containing protein
VTGAALTDVSLRAVPVAAEPGLLASVLASATDVILLVDSAGLVSGWNDAAETTWGRDGNGAHGRRLENLFAPEHRQETRDLLARTSAGRPARATTIALHGDGSRAIVEAACSAVGSSDGKPSDYAVVLRDVTEPVLVRSAASAVALEADASAALESFAAVLGQVIPVDTLTLAAVEGDATRRVASAGRAAVALRPGEIIPLAGRFGVALELRKPIVCLDTGAGEVPHDEVLAKHGVRSYVVLPLFHAGRVVAMFNVGFATTGAPTVSVVRLLGSLAASIMPIVLNLVTLEERERAIQRLEQLDALKDELIALITHDIRTPVAVIAGFADQLQTGWNELAEDKKLESIDIILRNVRNLYRLIEDVLRVARIEAGEFPYELRSVALDEEVKRAVADLTPADADRIRVSVQRGLPLVLCDPRRHWQILTNLLSNALKFSPHETTIDIELARRGPMVRVAVRDRGPGIERADFPRLFQKFSRLGGAQQSAQAGSGLGLYIAKALVQAQRGRIRVRNNPGGGSTFAYTLPVAERTES